MDKICTENPTVSASGFFHANFLLKMKEGDKHV